MFILSRIWNKLLDWVVVLFGYKLPYEPEYNENWEPYKYDNKWKPLTQSELSILS